MHESKPNDTLQGGGIPNGVTDKIVIRGRTIELQDLFRASQLGSSAIEDLAVKVKNATPFPHIDLEGLFNPVLLELVLEEFSLYSASDILANKSRYEATYRSAPGAHMGPATTLYFGIVNSGPFVNLLSQLTGIPDLLPDPSLYGGGLHESRNGGKFGIHRDFDRHPRNQLVNRMVFITYLNKGWLPEWNGALELWDENSKECVKKIEPEFGHSVLFLNGHHNFHGHPVPLATPEGISRRSIAAYYYTNTELENASSLRKGTHFMEQDALDRVKDVAREVVPPTVWGWLKKRWNGG